MGLDTLPRQYEEALRRFFTNRAMPLTEGKITGTTTVQTYIEGL